MYPLVLQLILFTACPNICARTTFHISGDGPHTFDWREYGFKLKVPVNALPAGQTQCDVHITTTLPSICQLNLPDNSIPVSAFYDISTPQTFSLPVTVELQHCAKTSQYASLSFVISKNEMPFEYLEGGEFPADTSYGRITITHFSKLGAILRRLVSRRAQPTAEPLAIEPFARCYCSQTFRERKELLKWTVHFIITCNLEVCKTVSPYYCIPLERCIAIHVACITYLRDWKQSLRSSMQNLVLIRKLSLKRI